MLDIKDYIDDKEDLDYPNFRSFLDGIATQWPERPALRYRAGKQREFETWSYSRLKTEAEAVSRLLISSGAKHGDRIAIWSENRPQWCAVYLGSVIAGLIIVPLDFTVAEVDSIAILKTCEPFAIFVSSQKASSIEALGKAAPSLKHFFIFPEGSAPYPSVDSAANARKANTGNMAFTINTYLQAINGAPNIDLPRSEAIDPNEVASIIFTSGTTGLSKGVMLSHRGIIENANASITSLPIYKEDVFMDVLPLHHSYPSTCCLVAPLCVGASVSICEKVIGKVILADTRDSGGSVFIGVPILFDKLMLGLKQGFKEQKPIARGAINILFTLSSFFRKLGWDFFSRAVFAPIRKKAGLGSVRLMVSGGGPLNPTTADFFNDFGICLLQGYGMSENGPLISVNTERYKIAASAGLRVKYTDIKILDSDAEGQGEIIVKSPSLMVGYWRNPEGTKQVFTDDGWLKTGDIGYMDNSGFLYITGRLKTLIVSAGGKNIFPEELEAKFHGSRVVAEILVVGQKRGDNDNAEDVVAVCVPNYEAIKADHPGRENDIAFIRSLIEAEVKQINRGLPPYKKISDFIIRNEEFEKTSSRKIKRFLYSSEYGKRKAAL